MKRLLSRRARGPVLILSMGLGMLAVQGGRPQWLSLLPAQTWAQLTVLMLLVMIGALVQWRLTPAGPPAGGAKKW
jgi:hypothetical protein